MSKNKIFSSLLAAMLLLSSCSAGSADKQAGVVNEALITPEEINYQTVDVTIADYVKTAQGGGSLYYPISDEIKWETENSRIVEMHVKREDEVKAGDVLATFAVEISHAELEDLYLQLQRTEEDLAEGKKERLKEINHAERILDYNFSREKKIATLELESMKIDYDLYVYEQERKIADLRESIAEIEESVSENTIVAPYDGVIDSVLNCYPGDRIDVGTVILSMHSTETFLVGINDNANKLRYNQEVTVEAGRKNDKKSFAGRVITAPNVLPEDAASSALIRVGEEVTPEDLKYSITFHANTEEISDVIVLDRTALSQDNGDYYVNILEDDMVKKRFVTIGSNNIQEYWILDGLEEGQSLVLN